MLLRLYFSLSRAVIAGFFVIALLILGLVGWCVWRFCKKKRPGKDKEKEAAKDDDENALVEHEEVKDEDVSSESSVKHPCHIVYAFLNASDVYYLRVSRRDTHIPYTTTSSAESYESLPPMPPFFLSQVTLQEFLASHASCSNIDPPFSLPRSRSLRSASIMFGIGRLG